MDRSDIPRLIPAIALVLLCAAGAYYKRFLLTGVCAVAVLLMRVWLVGEGWVFSPALVRSVDVLVGFTFLLTAVSLRSRLGDARATGEERIALVASLLGLPVAAVAVAQLIAPAAPQVSNATVCAGVPVAGSAMQARTGSSGLNSRSGPRTSYPPEGRLDIGCLVGVDGYCVGMPVQDLIVPLPDVRWLRLHHSKRYVAAGTMFAISPESTLGQAPEPDCPEGQADPELIGRPVIRPGRAGTYTVTVKPARTEIVGFALLYESSKPERVEQLGITPKRVRAGVVPVTVSVPALRGTEPKVRYVDLAAVPCLAPVVPSHIGHKLLRLDLRTGRIQESQRSALSDVQLTRLRTAACGIDPSAGDKAITEAADS